MVDIIVTHEKTTERFVKQHHAMINRQYLVDAGYSSVIAKPQRDKQTKLQL